MRLGDRGQSNQMAAMRRRQATGGIVDDVFGRNLDAVTEPFNFFCHARTVFLKEQERLAEILFSRDVTPGAKELDKARYILDQVALKCAHLVGRAFENHVTERRRGRRRFVCHQTSYWMLF